MACDTCGQTQQLVNSGTPPAWWCPTCGTIKTGILPDIGVPRIVPRAYAFMQAASEGDIDEDSVHYRTLRESMKLYAYHHEPPKSDDPCNSCVLYGADCVIAGRTPPCQVPKQGDDR